MPSKNRIKQYGVGCFYHLYNRGVNKRPIFLDDEDYRVYLNLLKRYLGEEEKDKKGRLYSNFRGRVELLAYCLMPNHFHLLVYLNLDENSITKLMSGVCTAYTHYFNKKYKRVGPLYQDVFKASLISTDDYAQHISRYIHLNPKEYLKWDYSSLPFYLEDKQASWLIPARILEMFDSREKYMNFLKDYEGQKAVMDELKYELADL